MKYEVIGWVTYLTEKFKAHKYITASVDNAIIKEVRKYGYCFGGDVQEEYCPVLNDGTFVLYSSRGWGALMAKAYNDNNDSGYAYMNYYMDTSIKSGRRKTPDFYSQDDDVVPKESLIETFVMHLSDDMFDAVKAGTKTVEIRLFDEKRQLVDIGDYIEFVKESDETQRVKRRVSDLDIDGTFIDRLSEMNFKDKTSFRTLRYSSKSLGFPEDAKLEEIVDAMHKYYTKEQEKQHGVVTFMLEEPKHTCRTCLNVWTNSDSNINLTEYNYRAYEKGESSSRIDDMDFDYYLYEEKGKDVRELIGEAEEDYVEAFGNRVVEVGSNEEYDADVNVMIRKTLRHLIGKEDGLRAIQDKYWLVMTFDVVSLTVKDSKEPPQNLELDDDIKEFLQKANIQLNLQKFEV